MAVLSKEGERWESITAALATILGKFDDQGARLTTLSDNYDTLKADQGRLHAAVNNVQSKQLELAASAQGVTHKQQHIDHPPDTSAIGGKVSALLNAATHKLWFPTYDGSDDPLPWLHRCEQFFGVARTPEKVWLASFYMQGAAQQWYYRLERNQGTPTGTCFTKLANDRFAPPPPTRSNSLGELCHLRLDESLDDYINKFYQRLTRCNELSEPQHIAIFTTGLGEPLKTNIKLHAPKTLEDVAALACAYIRRSTVAIAPPATLSHRFSGRSTVTTAVTPQPPQLQVPLAIPGAPAQTRPKAAPA
jgi:hypothetical protein